MITTNPTFASLSNMLTKEPIFYATIEGTTGQFSTRAVGTGLPWMGGLTNIAQKITPEDGKSSLSKLNLSLLDVGGQITEFTRSSNTLQNNQVRVFMGFQGQATASYLNVYTGKIANITPSRDALAKAYTFQLEDIQRTLRTTLFDDATAGNNALVTANPIDIILATLISTSTGGTSTYDFLTGGGFSIAPANVDIAGFEEIRDNWFDDWLFRFRFKKGIDNAKNWMEEQILRVCSCHLKVQGDGKLGLAFLGTAVPTVGAPLITTNNSMVRDYGFNWQSLINKVSINYDFSETSGKFATHNFFIDADSRVDRGFTKTHTMNVKGVHGANSLEGDFGGDARITEIKDRILDRFANPRPRAKVSVFMKDDGQLVEVGDRINYTHPDLPNPASGDRGFVAGTWEVLNKQWKLDGLKCDLEMENAGADFKRYIIFGPSTEVSGAATTVSLPVKDASCFNINDVIEVFCTGSDFLTSGILSIQGNTINLKSTLAKTPFKDALVQNASYDDIQDSQKKYASISDTSGTFTITGGSTTVAIALNTGSSLHFNTQVNINTPPATFETLMTDINNNTATVENIPLAPVTGDTLEPQIFGDGEGAYLIG